MFLFVFLFSVDSVDVQADGGKKKDYLLVLVLLVIQIFTCYDLDHWLLFYSCGS